MKDLEFNGSHISQIVLGKDWEAKLDWVENVYEGSLLFSDFRPEHISRVISGSKWLDKISWPLFFLLRVLCGLFLSWRVLSVA